MSFQPKDPSQDGHKNDQNSNHNKSHGLQPRQMSRRMGRSMNRFGSGEFSNTKLDSTVQAKMENAFQEDFSDVQVTKDSDEATQMGAQAFAQGNKIHFAPGNYKPQSTEGQELIGHELAHVVQQKQGRVKATTQAKGAPVNDDPALESEADLMGKKAAGGEQAVVQKQSKSGEVQRKEKKENDTDEEFVPKFYHFCSDFTQYGFVLESSGSYEYHPAEWQEDTAGTVLLGATVGLLMARITGAFNITKNGESLLGLLSGAATAKGFVLENRRKLYIANQKIWFGKVYHNIFTGKIVHVDESEVKDQQSTLIHHSYLQERIVYTLTNDIVATKTTPLMGMINSEPENIQNSKPKVGDSIY